MKPQMSKQKHISTEIESHALDVLTYEVNLQYLQHERQQLENIYPTSFETEHYYDFLTDIFNNLKGEYKRIFYEVTNSEEFKLKQQLFLRKHRNSKTNREAIEKILKII